MELKSAAMRGSFLLKGLKVLSSTAGASQPTTFAESVKIVISDGSLKERMASRTVVSSPTLFVETGKPPETTTSLWLD